MQIFNSTRVHLFNNAFHNVFNIVIIQMIERHCFVICSTKTLYQFFELSKSSFDVKA